MEAIQPNPTTRNPSLETYEDGGSITAPKMRAAAEKIDLPKEDEGLLSPYRDDAD